MAEAWPLADRLVKERQPFQLFVCWHILEHSQQDYDYAKEADTERASSEDAYGLVA